MTSYSVVSDGITHKVPASRVERAGGGDGCEDIRWDRCARPSAVRVTGGLRSFSVHHFFRIVYLAEMEAASIEKNEEYGGPSRQGDYDK